MAAPGVNTGSHTFGARLPVDSVTLKTKLIMFQILWYFIIISLRTAHLQAVEKVNKDQG